MSSNSGIRGTPLETSDDKAELSPDNQVTEEEAGLSPNNQIKGCGTVEVGGNAEGIADYLSGPLPRTRKRQRCGRG